MPEIVEVDFLREETAAAFTKHKVLEAALNNEKIANVSKDIFEKELVDETLTSTDRVGKILILNFSNDKHLLIHFLLTGFMRLIDENEKNKFQAYLSFDNDKTLGISGIMSQGFVNFYVTKDVKALSEISKLGVDALSKEFTVDKFKTIIKENENKTIKEIMMNQHLIAGLGNAYTDEILFLSSVHPKRKGKDISEEDADKIYKNIFEVIKKGKEFGGASELSFVHLDGKKGTFHEHFLVHKREGQKCVMCSGTVASVKIGGRSSYFCPNCQR